jgi:ABC-type microcin C transport system permease subunit YejB
VIGGCTAAGGFFLAWFTEFQGLRELGVVLVFGTVVILMNLLVDVMYAWIDPRIQSGRA